VAAERGGMNDVAARSAFLIQDGATIREAWMLGRELPDIDAVIAAAQAL
jgi:peroxiredoxin